MINANYSYCTNRLLIHEHVSIHFVEIKKNKGWVMCLQILKEEKKIHTTMTDLSSTRPTTYGVRGHFPSVSNYTYSF